MVTRREATLAVLAEAAAPVEPAGAVEQAESVEPEPLEPPDPLPGVRVKGPSITGMVRIHKGFESRWLQETRDLWIYLPPGYADATEDYPVLYMHDGNNLFDESTAFGGREWRVDESAERLITSGQLTPVIVVGVSNTIDRMDEYTYVTHVLGGNLMGGAGALYARFLIDEVKPFIDATYRTKPGREHSGCCGSSLGGLISLYLGIHHPDTFSRVGIMSPSLHWSREAALYTARRIGPSLRIWMDMGWREDDMHRPPAEIRQLRTLRSILDGKGYVAGENLAYFEDPRGAHSEGDWARRMPKILCWLFGPPRPQR